MTDSTTRFDRAPAAYEPTTDGFDRLMEAARLALTGGDRATAGQALEGAIAIAERTADGSSGLAIALSRLGEIRHLDGREGDAEHLFRRALEINERLLGPDHADLVVLLNDLSRLYLKRGAHADAEPLLLRLHAIKRAKGEEHPEVATVLASLASVKQALGRYDAAEQLWRRVIEIRERTLAPHHFSIATALEHLGDTCAARGKLNEALRHRLRALAMREMTLDPGHPSLRTARERIADLQLQASEGELDVDGPDAVRPAPVWLPPIAPAPVARAAAMPVPAASPVRESSPPTVVPPSWASQVAAEPVRQQAYVPPQTVPALQAAPAHPAAERSAAPSLLSDDDLLDDDDPGRRDITDSGGLQLVNVAGLGDSSRSVIMPYYAEAVALSEGTAEDEFGGPARAGFVSATMSFLRGRQAVIIGSVGVGALVLGTVAARSFAGGGSDDGWTSTDRARPAAAATLSEAAGAVDDSLSLIGAPGAPGVTPDDGTQRIPDRGRRPDEPVSSPDASRPVTPTQKAAAPATADVGPVPRTINVRVDPLQAEAPPARETLSAKVNLPTGGRLRSIASASDNETQPALLIASPTPVYPTSLYTKAIAGSATVDFVIDTNGRVDLSTFKSQSNHELFTEAVRHIMPDMRFVPSTSNGRKVRTPLRMRFEFTKSGVSSSRQN